MRYAERQQEKSSRRATVARWLSVLLFCCFLAVTGSAYAQIALPGPGLINTVAGKSTAGYSGDNGAAVSAQLAGPYDVVVDSAGNFYIADTGNNVIRKVTASTGMISTVAGNGTAGYSGDGGAATSAEINGATNVALDSAGNLYIADTGNNRIRKVTVSTGIISTAAGNGTMGYSGDNEAAVSAKLSGPSGVVVDSAGNLYIADTGNDVIREVTASTGIIATVAGGSTVCSQPTDSIGDGCPATSARLSHPEGVALDSAGNLYIADTGNIASAK